MAQPPTGPRPGWSVTTQTEQTRPNTQGTFVSGVQVSFQTVTGLTGTIFVPHTQYNAETVRKLITEKIDAMQSVQQLSG